MKIPIFKYPFIGLGLVNGKMRLIACCKCYSPIKHPATPKGAVWGLCNKHRKDETLKIVTAKS
jgi:hypothetical protein